MEFFKYKMMKITVVCLIILFIIILCFPFAYSTVRPDKGATVNQGVNEGVNQGVNQGINNSNVVQEEQVVSEESEEQVQEEIAEENTNSEEHKSESSYNFRAHAPVSKEPVQELEETDINLEVDSN